MITDEQLTEWRELCAFYDSPAGNGQVFAAEARAAIPTLMDEVEMLREDLGNMTSSERDGWARANHAAAELDERWADIKALRAEVERLMGLSPELPPFPPEGEGLPRYGIRWNGPGEPLAVPMKDGYWSPWHLTEALRVELAEAKALAVELKAEIDDLAEGEGFGKAMTERAYLLAAETPEQRQARGARQKGQMGQ